MKQSREPWQGMKPLSALLIVSLVFSLVLAACSGTDNKKTDTKGAGKEAVTIDFWFPWAGDYQKDFKKECG